MPVYPGSMQKISMVFDDLAGADADPTTITLTIMKPDQTLETPITQAGMVRESLGHWYALYTPPDDGRYHYRIATTGTPTVVDIFYFDIDHDGIAEP